MANYSKYSLKEFFWKQKEELLTLADVLENLGYHINEFGWLPNAVGDQENPPENLSKLWHEYPSGTPVKVKRHHVYGHNFYNGKLEDSWAGGDGILLKGGQIKTDDRRILIASYLIFIPKQKISAPLKTTKVIMPKEPHRKNIGLYR